MTFFKPSSRENKRLTELIDKICKEFDIDKSVALHFINADLERIYKERIHIHDIEFTQLEIEIKKHIKSEIECKQEIANKELLIKNTLAQIDNSTLSLNEKTELLATRQQELSELKNKLSQINSSLRENEKETKQVRYDVMMKSHSRKEQTDKTHQYLKIFLTIITIIAIFIVTILIYKK